MPVLSDLYSLQGLIQLSETLDEVRKKSNPDLRAAGILLTRYNPREWISTLIRETSAEIAQRLDIPLLDTTIRSSVMLTRAQILREDITKYASKNKAADDYRRLVDELIRREVL